MENIQPTVTGFDNQPSPVKKNITLSEWAEALSPHLIPFYFIVTGQWNLLTVLSIYWVEVLVRIIFTTIKIALSNGNLPIPDYSAVDGQPARPRTKSAVLFDSLTINIFFGVIGGLMAILFLRFQFNQQILFTPWLGVSALLSVWPLVWEFIVFVRKKKYLKLSAYWAQGGTVGHSLTLFASLFSIVFLNTSFFGFALGTLIFMGAQIVASLARVLSRRNQWH